MGGNHIYSIELDFKRNNIVYASFISMEEEIIFQKGSFFLNKVWN